MADLHTGVGTAPAALGLGGWNQAQTGCNNHLSPKKYIIKGNTAHQTLGRPFLRPPHTNIETLTTMKA